MNVFVNSCIGACFRVACPFNLDFEFQIVFHVIKQTVCIAPKNKFKRVAVSETEILMICEDFYFTIITL